MSDPNDQNNESVFINSRVEYPMTDFGPTSNHDSKRQNIVYDLFATINHHPTKEGKTNNMDIIQTSANTQILTTGSCTMAKYGV
jgi:hypothetical protein